MYYFACFLCFLYVAHATSLENIMVDMSYPYDENVQVPPSSKKFDMRVIMNGSAAFGVWVQIEEISTPTHMGTHMDAPAHFVPGGMAIDKIAIEDFIAPAAVVSIVAKAAKDPDAEATVEDFQTWESTTGQSLNGTVVLVNSGWGAKWHNCEEFLGTLEEDATKLRFPGVSPEASQWLVDNRNIKGIGVDTISIDKGSSKDYRSHQIILGKNLYILENVANMDKIPIYGATLYVMPMKISYASGAPTRIIASYPKIACV